MAKIPEELFLLPFKEIARICQVSEKTVSRWRDGTTCPPKTALMIIARDLGCFSPAWRHWTIRGEELISPEGWCITMGDVLASPLLRQQLAIYQAENRGLKAELASREGPQVDQPMPAENSAILAEALKLLG